jgi:hypothetical protein
MLWNNLECGNHKFSEYTRCWHIIPYSYLESSSYSVLMFFKMSSFSVPILFLKNQNRGRSDQWRGFQKFQRKSKVICIHNRKQLRHSRKGMWNRLCEGEVSSERGEGKWRGSKGYGWFAFIGRVGGRSCGLYFALGTGKASILTLAASSSVFCSGFVGHGSWEIFALVGLEPGSSKSHSA